MDKLAGARASTGVRNLSPLPAHKSDTLGMGRGRIAWGVLVGGLVFVLSGCTASTQPSERPTVSDEASKSSVPGELMGQGTVLQRLPAEPVFCLGNIAASDPPRCSGPVIHGWNWDSVSGSKTVGTVTYGDYLLQGTWDGKTFPLGQTPPRPLGLNEYVRGPSDPRRDAAHRGPGKPDQLRKIRNDLSKPGDPTTLYALVENGYVFLRVITTTGGASKRWTAFTAQRLSKFHPRFGPPPNASSPVSKQGRAVPVGLPRSGLTARSWCSLGTFPPRWIGGPEAGGTALLMLSTRLGAYFAVGWGGDCAPQRQGCTRARLGMTIRLQAWS